MTRRPLRLVRAVALSMACISGCHSNGQRVSSYPQAPGCDRCSTAQPYSARAYPLPVGPAAPNSVPVPSSAQPNWQPGGEPGVRLSPPESIGDETARDYSRQYPPQTAEPPVAAVPAKPREGSASTSVFPVDIPQFVIAKKGVASGQQPFSDGVAWLQSHGYRTVLHVRPPEDTGTAAEQIFKRRGLKYVSLHVSPTTLSRDVVEQFNRVVADEGNQPLFVFDRDGSLAGGLWYLHFRLVDGLPDEKARTEATRLGFRDEGAHKTMWIAVQKYLQDQKP